MKIFDCFQFFDEDMMLDLRMNILDQYVDKFVIVENLYMHSGKKKNKISKLKNIKNLKTRLSIFLLINYPKI